MVNRGGGWAPGLHVKKCPGGYALSGGYKYDSDASQLFVRK